MVRAGARPSGEGVSFFAAYGAQEGAPKRGEGATAPGSAAPFVVLDTLCFSHYEVLGRLALAREHAGFQFTAVTPQAKTGHGVPSPSRIRATLLAAP